MYKFWYLVTYFENNVKKERNVIIKHNCGIACPVIKLVGYCLTTP
jgi:hypothetical protein